MQTCFSSLARPGAPTPRTLAVSLRLFEDNRRELHRMLKYGMARPMARSGPESFRED